MKAQLREAVARAVGLMIDEGLLPAGSEADIPVERTRDRKHGDFASNVAMTLARAARRPPRELADQLIARLPDSNLWSEVTIAGPGFINFTLAPSAYHRVVGDALEEGAGFGTSSIGANRSVQVEFVSANPTGPLHVGHGRGAAYGDTLANLLQAVGFEVQREYYVNDAGRQMDILALSVWLRYLELCGERPQFPANGYRGDYVVEIARMLKAEQGDELARSAEALFEGIPADEPAGGDKEIHVDALVQRSRTLLGEASYRQVFQRGLQSILTDIREDLHEFGVDFDHWYSERSLSDNALIDKAVALLEASQHVYEKDGALWFRATAFGDEKDRVVRRENGQTTYFASDIAYHMDKLDRGFERIINVWGADHHGYIARVKAALAAMGRDPDRLDVLLVQFANLYRGGEKVQMSTRSGSFVTLRELREEVGADSARFFYVMRKCEQHLDFDLDLAKSRSNDNPMYYVQYAHARICSVMTQLENKGLQHDMSQGMTSLDRLDASHEQALLVGLSRYPESVEAAALNEDPHLLTHYLRDLANDFHTYYNAHQFLVTDASLRDARLNLILATRQAIANGLTLLGVSAPESM